MLQTQQDLVLIATKKLINKSVIFFIDAPNTARSGFNSKKKKKLLNKSAIFFFSKIDLIRVWLQVSGYRPEHIGRTAMDIPMNASAAVPPANPSRPSVNSIPFAIETKQNEVNNT
ncbi:hypothetical protein HanRHA438_Chr01g0024801 [Helianthus annuus]|nr:hypothetical protein HanRHA438_Chr01g0024801 [Helianthus annuus]